MDLSASLYSVASPCSLSLFSPPLLLSSFLLPLSTYFSLFRHLLFPLLVWRFCLFVCCCLHVWMRHSSLTSSEEFHTRDTPLSSPYTPSSTTHGEFDRFAFSFFLLLIDLFFLDSLLFFFSFWPVCFLVTTLRPHSYRSITPAPKDVGPPLT